MRKNKKVSSYVSMYLKRNEKSFRKKETIIFIAFFTTLYTGEKKTLAYNIQMILLLRK